MNTLIVAVIISAVTADIPTTTTIHDRNNSESTYIQNFTESTIKVSVLTTENSELVNTTESTNVLLSRKNGTITRQGKIIEEINNASKDVQYRNHEISNEDRNDTNREENNQLQIEFITKPPDTQRNVLKIIFQKILSYKNIHLEKDYDKDEKDKIIKAYLLLVSQKYKRKWVPKNLNMTLKGRPTIKRQKRSIKEDAGFTHDSETCKQYNHNLLLMWSNLSKYISTSEKSPPNKSVLHNIGIMIKAYLDHVTPIEIRTEAATEKLIVRKERNISTILSPIINEIKTKMDRREINEVNTLTAFILNQVKHFRIDNINEECNQIIQNEIAKLINLAFKKYLLYANCNHLYNNENNNGNVNILNNTPLNQELYNNLQPLMVSKIDESRFDQNLLKVVKRSLVETTTNIANTSTQVIDLLLEKDVNNSNSSNLITNESNISNENQLKDIQDKRVQTRRAKLNSKFCADLALDQFILTVKLILRLYLLNDDCTSGAYKFTIISKLIEATPILEPFNGSNLEYLSKYHVLLRLLDNMEAKEMGNLFTTKTEVLQNKNTLEQFLHDINNLALSMKSKQKENNKMSDNDLKNQLLLNSLYNYQQLHNNDRLLKPKNIILSSVNAEDNSIPIGNNKVSQNVKELQGMYTGVPINQHYEANRSIFYEYLTNKTYDKPIAIGSTINSGSMNFSKNYLGTSDSKSAIFPNLFSATEKDYSKINPMQYNLMMNYSETYPTNFKGNSASLGSFATFPYLNLSNSTSVNMNPFKNTLLHQNLISNPDTLSSYFAKLTKINHSTENQIKNSPSVPNNGVLLNLLNNNRAMLNNNFNTKSEATFNEANVNTFLRNPALQQRNLNTPSNFGVSYYKQINNAPTNNMNSDFIKNDNFDLLRDNNLVRDKNDFNPFNLMNPKILRSNPNFNDIKNSFQPNGNLILRNSYPLRTLNAPQIQKTPIIYRTDLNPNSFNGLFLNNQSLNGVNSNYIKTQPIQTSKTSGIPLNNIQSIEKPKQDLSTSSFINPYSATLINKDNEFNNHLNSAFTPVLRSNFLRMYDKKLETKSSPITSIDNLPTISSDPDSNGDVELTYVYHHPQIVVYQPQVLVKRRISYIDYINNFNKIFNNQKKTQQLHLYKIIRYLPYNNVQVLYQSDSIVPILKIENTTSSN